jgi:hypothetical protein
MKKQVITEEEKQGMIMIQYLQSMAGKTETDEQALTGWRSFSQNEKDTTKRVYDLFKKKA